MMDLISYQIVSINTKKNKRKVLAEVLDKDQVRAIAMRYGRTKKVLIRRERTIIYDSR